MNRRKLFTGFLFWIVPLALLSQRYVSGRITDANDGEPVPGASVFISNTTVGIATDTEGYYRLKIPGEGSYKLAVSHAAYQPFSGDIEPGQKSITLNASMHIRELEEVTVAKKVKFRQEDIDLFWKTILGENPSKNTIFATNPKAVFYYYNSKTNLLTVTCRVPLQIINNETGYEIEYILDHFTHDYNTNTTHWEFQPKFTELEPKSIKQKYTWGINRENVYSVSMTNFIRSLYSDSLEKNGFLLISFNETDFRDTTINQKPDIFNHQKAQENITPRKIYLINPERFVSTDSVHLKTLNVPSDSTIMLACFGKSITDKEAQLMQAKLRKWASWLTIGLFRNKIETPDTTIYIFPDGTFKNSLKLSPKIASKPLTGLSMTLPIEYNLDIDSTAIAQVSDSIADNKPVVKELPATFTRLANPLADSLKSVIKRFEKQLRYFPQEKVYFQIDKPYYLSDERIWFLSHIVDATSHLPDLSAISVFVELFDVQDLIVCR